MVKPYHFNLILSYAQYNSTISRMWLVWFWLSFVFVLVSKTSPSWMFWILISWNFSSFQAKTPPPFQLSFSCLILLPINLFKFFQHSLVVVVFCALNFSLRFLMFVFFSANNYFFPQFLHPEFLFS